MKIIPIGSRKRLNPRVQTLDVVKLDRSKNFPLGLEHIFTETNY